jgi:predicted N-acetyltransferase YhbS
LETARGKQPPLDDVFMALELQEGMLDGNEEMVRYQPEFREVP